MKTKYYFLAFGKLIASLSVDIIGMITYLAPGHGELMDGVLAFISKAIVNNLYIRNTRSKWVFLEEILPFTDIIPSASIIWCIKYFGAKREALQEYHEKYVLPNQAI